MVKYTLMSFHNMQHAFIECTPEVKSGYPLNENVDREPSTLMFECYILFHVKNLHSCNSIAHCRMILMYILPFLFDYLYSTLHMS